MVFLGSPKYWRLGSIDIGTFYDRRSIPWNARRLHLTSALLVTKEISSQSKISSVDFSEADRWAIASGLSDAGLVAMGSRFLTCREKSLVYVCNDCNNAEIVPASCNVRFCPRCNSKRFKSLQEKFGENMSRMSAPMFISISVPNFPEIQKTVISTLRAWFSRLRRRKSFSSVRGGFYDFDVVFWYDSNWNLHIHGVIDCFWLDRDAVLKDWLEITSELGGETRNLYIERAYYITSKKGVKTKIHWTPSTRPGIKLKILKACSDYIVAHATKAPSVPTPQHLAEYLIAAYHSRLLQGFGSMFDIATLAHHKICVDCGGISWSFLGFVNQIENTLKSMHGLEIIEFGSDFSFDTPLPVSHSKNDNFIQKSLF